ncbi:hypothetical protein C2845_PM10G09840 [Panicum miliaceum]|uniref:Uncharacterized protein n=1 Tax=Panicum miliaceum TaxID=4540 RepID=A0A3L6PF56_PANMI|nr:hypothetical protein C2845_PM10G09840 [Panicum miliaceum]
MARLLARPSPSPFATAASASLHGLTTNVDVIEIDFIEEDVVAPGSSAASPSCRGGGDPVIRHLEEAIHGVMVRHAIPDWLPFMGRIAAARDADGLVGDAGGTVEVMEL